MQLDNWKRRTEASLCTKPLQERLKQKRETEFPRLKIILNI